MHTERFTVLDPLRANAYEVELPLDTPMSQVIPELIAAMSLQPGSYALQIKRIKRILGPDDTLKGSTAIAGDKLEIVAAPVAA